MVNRVTLIGRLTADPEVRQTTKGNAVANLRLVTSTFRGRDEDGKATEQAEFHQLVVFGKQAQVAADYLRKGKLIFADGRLQTRSWEDDSGKKRYATEVVVENFQMLGPKSAENLSS
jgi:single-strand DNA-binding protein